MNHFFLLALPLNARIQRSYIGSMKGMPALVSGVDSLPKVDANGVVEFTGEINGGATVNDAFLASVKAKTYGQLAPMLTADAKVGYVKDEASGLAILGFSYPDGKVPSIIASGFALEATDSKAVFRVIKVDVPSGSASQMQIDAAAASARAASFITGALGTAALITALKA